MTNKNFKLLEKDNLIKQLIYLIKNDNGWLTPVDQHVIESKIEELNLFINERYRIHGRPNI